MCFTVKHFPFLKWGLGLRLFVGIGMENFCGWTKLSTEKFFVFLQRCPLLWEKYSLKGLMNIGWLCLLLGIFLQDRGSCVLVQEKTDDREGREL